MNILEEDYFTTKEVAAAFHCNERHISHLRMAGLLKGIKTGKNYIYSRKDIETFFEENKGRDLSNVYKANFYGKEKEKRK